MVMVETKPFIFLYAPLQVHTLHSTCPAFIGPLRETSQESLNSGNKLKDNIILTDEVSYNWSTLICHQDHLALYPEPAVGIQLGQTLNTC